MSERMVILGRIFGSLGMVALVSTLLTYALTRELGWMIYGKLIFGVAAAIFYFFTNSQALRGLLGSRSAVYTSASITTVLGFFGAMGAVNFLGAMYNHQVDLTKEGIFSLSDQTRNVLSRLDRDVVIMAFYRPEEPDRGLLEALVDRYRLDTERVTITFINPEKDPAAVKLYKITESGPRVLLRSGNQETKLRNVSEEDLTNGIVKVALTSAKTILFLVGHGEADIHSAEAEGYQDAAAALADEGYTVETVSLLDKSRVPEGAGGVIVAAPKTPLLQPEIEMLHGYLVLGGHVMILLEPGEDAGLTAFLSDWRIGIAKDKVVDMNPMSRAFGFGADMPIIQKLEQHRITHGMKASVVFPTVRSVNGLQGAVQGVTATEVVRTSEGSWGEVDFDNEPYAKDPGDFGGPVPILTVATKGARSRVAESSQTRLLVVGDHQFANNRFLPMLGNKDLFLNAVNWLVEEEERIAIRPKSRGTSRLLITETEASFVKFFTIDIVPMVLLAAGVAVWQLRRRK
jgi:ABC-type uncharacterized transport system involved in gliding motility auxiliary subunit